MAYRSKGEVAVAKALQRAGIPFIYEARLDLSPVPDSENSYRAVDGVVYTRPDFYLLDGTGLVIEYAGMLDRADYFKRHGDKLDLYAANDVACVQVLPEHLRGGQLSVSLLEQMIADTLNRAPAPSRDLDDLVRGMKPD